MRLISLDALANEKWKGEVSSPASLLIHQTSGGGKIPAEKPFKRVNTFSSRLIIFVYSISWPFVQCSLENGICSKQTRKQIFLKEKFAGKFDARRILEMKTPVIKISSISTPVDNPKRENFALSILNAD